MASKAFVVAHNNEFNKGVLKNNAVYISSAKEVKKIMESVKKIDNLQFIENNFKAIINDFNWEKINDAYLQLFNNVFSGNKTAR